MSKSVSYILFFLALALVFSSCKEKDSNLSAIKFGTITQYNPSFGQQPFDEILKIPLEIEFNDYALQQSGQAELEWVLNNGSKPKNINFYVNGTKIIGNSFKVNTQNYRSKRKVYLGIQFKDGIAEEKFKGYLRIKNSDLDRIENIDIASNPNGELFRWEARFKKTLHPIVQGILFALACICTLLLLWFLLLKPYFYPRFKRGELEILEPNYRLIKIKGYKNIFLGGKEKVKQGFFSKLFTGKTAQFLKEYPDMKIELIPFRRRGNIWLRIKTDPMTEISPIRKGTIYNFDEMEIEAPNGEKIKIVYKNSKNNRRA